MGRSECCSVGTSFDATRWLSLDGCGFLCISCSFGVHIYATTVIALFLVKGSPTAQILYGAVYLPLMTLAVLSLIKAWTTDPGSVPLGARPLTTVKKAGGPVKKQRAIRRCNKCNDNFKPPRAHHDSVTGRCIVKFDHYCPWVGNAIGAMNHKFFVLFIGYTLCTCILSICFIFLRFVRCGYVKDDGSGDEADAAAVVPEKSYHEEEDWAEPDNKKEDATRFLETTYVYPECDTLFSNYFVIILMVVAVAFMVFTCCMLFEQLEAIESNQSKIARMKLKVGQGGTELERVSHDFNEMFGGNSPRATWHWFLPLSVKFPQSMDKIVLGYEWDPTFGDEPFQEDDMVAAIKGETKSDVDMEDPPVERIDGKPKEETSSLSTNNSLQVGAKKRSRSKGKKPEDKPTFVDRTKDRLT